MANKRTTGNPLSRTGFIALEPRVLLDAAAVATGLDAVDDASTSEIQFVPPVVEDSGAQEGDILELFQGYVPPDSRVTADTLVFIDGRVPDAQSLIDQFPENTRVVVLDAGQDGVTQISQVLEGYQDVQAVHIISHGEEAQLLLGSTVLDGEALEARSDEMSGWSQALSSDADILIYGCDLGRGEAGQDYVQRLAEITGADVAASLDSTGGDPVGGDWDLEIVTGDIEADAPLVAASDYAHELITVTWDNDDLDDNWFNPNNWSGNALPLPADDVIINDISGVVNIGTGATANINSLTVTGETLNVSAGTLNIATPSATSGVLNLSGGYIRGSTTLTVTGTMNWTGGTIGSVPDSHVLLIDTGATLNISGAAVKNVAGYASLQNDGSTTWSGSGDIVVGAFGDITNLGNGVFDIQNDQGIFGGGSFYNSGVINKNPSIGTTQFGVPFNNNAGGSVNIATGELYISNGGASAGDFDVAAGAKLWTTSTTYTIDTGATMTGDGLYELVGGNLDFAAASTSVPNLNVTGGNLTGTVTVTDTMTWSGGQLGAGGGLLTVDTAAVMNITNVGSVTITNYALSNLGTINWTGGGSIDLGLGAVINNQTDAVFNDQNEHGVTWSDGTVAFNNAGTYNKNVDAGATQFGVSVPFNNNGGTVNVVTGNLFLNGGGVSTGAFDVAAGKKLQFAASTYTLNTGTTMTGAGVYEVAATGTLDFAAAIDVPNLDLTPSASVTGTPTVTGVMNWTGGQLGAGGGTLTVDTAAVVNVTASGGQAISDYTLSNQGTINLSTVVSMGAGAVISNQTGGIFNLQNTINGAGAFNNTGTVNGAGGTVDGVTFTNNTGGTVNVNAGGLILNSSGNNNGDIILNGGNLGSTTDLPIENGFLTGTGSVAGNVIMGVSGGTGGISPGALIGAINIAGNWNAGATGKTIIEINNVGTAGTDYDLINAPVMASLGGTLEVQLTGGFVPSAGNSFTIITGYVTGTFNYLNLPSLPAGLAWQVTYNPMTSVVLEVVAATTATWTNGSGDENWYNPLNWDLGGIEIPTTIHDVVINDFVGFEVNALGGTPIMVNTITINGETVNIDGSDLGFAGESTTSGILNLTTGSIGYGGKLIVTNTMNWNGGTIGPGNNTVFIDTGATLNIGGTLSTVDSYTLDSQGTANWTGGGIQLQNGAQINNLAGGVFNVQSDQTMADGGGAAVAFNNNGTFNKDASVGTTLIDAGVVFNNNAGGTMNLQSGILEFADDTASSGNIVLNGGSVEVGLLNVEAGTLSGDGDVTGNLVTGFNGGAGAIAPGFSPGTINISGVWAPTATSVTNIQITDIGGDLIFIPGTDFDVINVGGSAFPNGTLNVTLLGGFLPQAGDNFQIINAADVTPGFSGINLPTLGPGLGWQLNYGAADVSLAVVTVPIPPPATPPPVDPPVEPEPIEPDPLAFEIPENTANGSLVGQVTVTGLQQDAIVSYNITEGNTDSAFEVDANGQILVADSAILDFESIQTFDLVIQVADANQNTHDVEVTVTLVNVNEPPTAVADDGAPTVEEGGSLTFSLDNLLQNDTDPEEDPISIISVGQPGNGVLIPNNFGGYTYIPNEGFSGIDSFTYTISDGQGGEDSAIFYIEVQGRAYQGGNTVVLGQDDGDESPTATEDEDPPWTNQSDAKGPPTMGDGVGFDPIHDTVAGDSPRYDPFDDLDGILDIASRLEEAGQGFSDVVQLEAQRFNEEQQAILETLREAAGLYNCEGFDDPLNRSGLP